MNVLLGTTNPAKRRRFAALLAGCDVTLCTPAELGIHDEPAETGATPTENAVCKAQFYSRWCDRVICNDTGLYFDALPLDDSRQPGLHIRAPQGVRMDEEALIRHYADLIATLGGRVQAYYLDGVAVYRQGHIETFQTDLTTARRHAFDMVSVPASARRPGWPLDAISRYRDTGRYFVDVPQEAAESVLTGDDGVALAAFLRQALGATPGGTGENDDAQLCDHL